MSGLPEGDSQQDSLNGAGSLIDRVRARREERVADEHLDLPVPTWGGELVARFRVVDSVIFERIAKRLQSGKTDTGADADFLCAACAGVFVRDDDGPLEAVLCDGKPVAFDKGLADVLGVEVERAREVVYYLVKDNQLALSLFAVKVINWMQDTSAEVEGQIVGEA